MKDNSELIFRHAWKDNGLSETSGKGSTPRIKLAIKSAASWLDQDDSLTPWCGCIRGLWGLETGTGVPPAHYRAASWLKWGEPVKLPDAKMGDTIILKRHGGHHVGLVASVGPAGYVSVYGGNQSNSTNTKSFPTSIIVGIRRGKA